MSLPTQAVPKTLQPPSSGGFFEERRAEIALQSADSGQPATEYALMAFYDFARPLVFPKQLAGLCSFESNGVLEGPQSIGDCGRSRLQDQRRLDFVKRAIPNGG